MKAYTGEQIRTVGLTGHGDTGKTSLVTAFLYTAGLIDRLGRVAEGQSVTDFDEEEIERGVSIWSALAHAEWATPAQKEKVKINFIDTPGYNLFINDTKSALVAADSALILVDSVSGPEVVTEKVWDYAVEYDLPRVFVVNKMDRENASYERTLAALQERFGRAAVPVALPLGEEKNFRGLVDLIGMKAWSYEADGNGRATVADIPSELAEAAQKAHEALVEMVAEGDDKLMEEFFEKGTLPEEDLRQGLRGAVLARRVHPVVPACALHNIGSDSLLNYTRETNERLQHTSVAQGKQHTQVAELHAGDIGVVSKLKETLTGDTLGDKGAPIHYPPIKLPTPLISSAVEPKTRQDEEKMSAAMHKILEEDPSLQYGREEQTREFLLSGSGQRHIEIVVSKLKKRYGVEVTLKAPKVPYRETIRARAEAEGRHKKQTGGRGQFGVARIKMEPLERGAGFEFVDDIFGGAIPRNFIPSVEKGIVKSAARGYLAGFPVVDFRAILYDGQYHDVDSSDIAFQIAGSLAFKKAMEQAKPALLEPVMNVEVYAPQEFSGDLMGDLSARRGRIQGMDTRGSMTVIKGQAPMSEMLDFATSLTSITQGRGSYHMEFAHYDFVPYEIEQKIIAQRKRGEEAEEEEA